MQIVVNLAEDRVTLYDRDTAAVRATERGVLLCGPRSGYSVIDTAGQFWVFGFHFQPGGLLPFLRMPLDEIHDQEIGLDCLWGRIAGELRERLLAAVTPEAMFREAERYLLSRAVRAFDRHPAVAFALRELTAPDGRPVSWIVDRTGFSWRRFNELFRREVGLTPKVFARVQRFQSAVKTIGAGTAAVDWSALAAGCGYYDQGHFIHDFRGFSGLTPTAYLRARTEHLNHVPLDF